MRDICCQEIMKHSERYKDFIVGNLKEYVYKLSQDKYWCGEIALYSISNALQFDIIVYDMTRARVNYIRTNYKSIKDICELIYINNNHYNLKKSDNIKLPVLNTCFGKYISIHVYMHILIHVMYQYMIPDYDKVCFKMIL